MEGGITVRGDPSRDEHGPLPRLDTGVAQSARVWNYLQGGKDNFAADREAADAIGQLYPEITLIARSQRRFLARSVRYLAGQASIRQFLDVGTGLPADDNTHTIAQRIAPTSRIVYVDNDPLVLLHARALMISGPEGATSYIEADVRDIEEILHEAARTLDLSQPVALLLLGVMGEIPDADRPREIVAGLLRALPAGSYVALSDATDTSPALNRAIDAYNQRSANPYLLRSPREIASFFDGLTFVSPGLIAAARWHSDANAPAAMHGTRQSSAFCGLGRKD
jgi:hypothetical protein